MGLGHDVPGRHDDRDVLATDPAGNEATGKFKVDRVVPLERLLQPIDSLGANGECAGLDRPG
jgi:hypothetical protein